MSLEFEAPLGARLHRYYCGITHFAGPNLWWSYEKREWLPGAECGERGYSNHAPCRTLRAFKRHLRKHPSMIGKAILVSRYRDHNVYSRSTPSSTETPIGQEEGA